MDTRSTEAIMGKQKKKLESKLEQMKADLELIQRFGEYEKKRVAIIEKFGNLVSSPRPDIDFNISENSRTVLSKRYLKKDENRNVIETPEERLWSTAVHIAMGRAIVDENETENSIHQRAQRYYEMMATAKFLPNSPTLMNAGNELGQLSACFVIPVPDNTEGIFRAITETALIHKSGGGTGFSFSRLRPREDIVSTTHGVASGPVSFMRVFDASTEEIKQGGTRRGANMGILNVNHPDVLEFIKCKDEGGIQNFNISVGITEDFYKKALAGEEYDLINPRTGKVTGKLNAKDVLDKIVDGAWRHGDPGMIFIDRLNKGNPTPNVGKIESTNPCGEQPLLPYESCNLGSINLARLVEGDKLDWEKLKETTRNSVEFLNDVVDMNAYPLPQIWEMTHGNRKIGLGVMGFADMLVKMGVQYDSDEGLKLAEKVMKTIHETGKEKSGELAKKYGEFPNFAESIFSGEEPLTRNATITTIAPTGTISIIGGASSGIEPFFAISYVREKILDGDPMPEVNALFEKVAKERGFYSEDLMRKIAKTGSVQGIEEVPEDVQRLFRTALDIAPEWHLKMQAAFQKYTDNAVSKTVNLPYEATREDFKKAYDLMFELGCKGVTIYRDKSRDQVLNIGERQEKDPLETKLAVLKGLREKAYSPGYEGRGKVLPAIMIKEPISDSSIDTENLYAALAFRCGEAWEMFANSKGWDAAMYEAMATNTIHISRRLQLGEDPQKIAKDLRGMPGPNQGRDKFGSNYSSSDALSHVLELDRFKALPGFNEQLVEKMMDLEILLLRGLITTYDERVNHATRMAEIKINGKNGSQPHNEAPSAGSSNGSIALPKKPCPDCGSVDYTVLASGGCEYYSCCYYSAKCS